jgi:hypothetical protein
LGDIYISYLYILLSQKDSGFFDEKGKFLIEPAFADFPKLDCSTGRFAMDQKNPPLT